MNRNQFVARMITACRIAKQKGAVINTPAAIAQAALESGWGNSLLAAKYNNLFGIKAGKGWTGQTVKLWTREWTGKEYIKVMAPWRVYPSWNECLVDYSRLIQRLWWFKDALPHADKPTGDGNAEQWIARLVDRDQPGELAWATGPSYVAKVMAQADQIERVLAALEREKAA